MGPPAGGCDEKNQSVWNGPAAVSFATVVGVGGAGAGVVARRRTRGESCAVRRVDRCGLLRFVSSRGRRLAEVTDAINGMIAARPAIRQVIIKTNEGVSGAGNALVDLAGIVDLPEEQRPAAIDGRVRAMQLESATLPLDTYVSKFEKDGGIVEERIVGEKLLSPSVQLRIRPDRSLELLSTHDQLLGGASGQSYLGCIFPANPAYSRLISKPAITIGE